MTVVKQFARTELLLGSDALEKLANSRVAVFGIGGVGGFVVEALARSGVGALDLVDNDDVSVSNINRQIIATHKTVGRAKTEVMRERILEINPKARVTERKLFYLPENADDFPLGEFDYVVDAVDTVAAKLELAVRCEQLGVPLISSMGTGNKLNPCALKVADIYETRVCPLARIMRKELRKRGVRSLKVVYSEETPLGLPADDCDDRMCDDGVCGDAGSQGSAHDGIRDVDCEESDRGVRRRSTPGSVAFVPSVAGLIIAGEVVKDLTRRAGGTR